MQVSTKVQFTTLVLMNRKYLESLTVIFFMTSIFCLKMIIIIMDVPCHRFICVRTLTNSNTCKLVNVLCYFSKVPGFK